MSLGDSSSQVTHLSAAQPSLQSGLLRIWYGNGRCFPVKPQGTKRVHFTRKKTKVTKVTHKGKIYPLSEEFSNPLVLEEK